MKILHSADWHLDSPLGGFSEEQAKFLRAELLQVPDRVVTLCKSENCDLLLLAGDLFDGQCTKESLLTVKSALEEVKIPVFISPGNHDFCRPDSPYLTESWPENVHIFTHAAIESVTLQDLDCTVYGAGYEGYFGHGLGHSVGLEIHENPRFSMMEEDIVEAGMIMTVEPGIYIPDFGGVRIEDMVVMTEDGYENLTNSRKELIEL